MCGRFSLYTPKDRLERMFECAFPNLRPAYNIGPARPVLTVRMTGFADEDIGLPKGKAMAAWMRWGLIPGWSKDPEIGSRLINARAETMFDKPSFRAASRRRRCLIPADGFFEWKTFSGTGRGTKKIPYRFAMEDGDPFAFGGLWERWLGADGSDVETCTIVTVPANPVVAPVHARMPLILDREDFARWMRGGEEEARSLLKPYSGKRVLVPMPVSGRVNNVANDDPSVLEPSGEGDADGGNADETLPRQRSLF